MPRKIFLSDKTIFSVRKIFSLGTRTFLLLQEKKRKKERKKETLC